MNSNLAIIITSLMKPKHRIEMNVSDGVHFLRLQKSSRMKFFHRVNPIRRTEIKTCVYNLHYTFLFVVLLIILFRALIVDPHKQHNKKGDLLVNYFFIFSTNSILKFCQKCRRNLPLCFLSSLSKFLQATDSS